MSYVLGAALKVWEPPETPTSDPAGVSQSRWMATGAPSGGEGRGVEAGSHATTTAPALHAKPQVKNERGLLSTPGRDSCTFGG